MKNKNQKNIIEIIISLSKDPILLNAFLKDILTTVEYKEIHKRWEIIKMLDLGINQHEIAKNIHVGVATVTRGSRVFNNPNGVLKKILKNHPN
ncbi:MAG: Trp family transcriptional regulator [Candidatus Nomurabacteria bacterium]|nr:Trp family transcriptional regulator [Candidatus Nomurabacteria bacterium]